MAEGTDSPGNPGPAASTPSLEAIQAATSQLEHLSQELQQRAALRASNAAPNRPSEATLRELDSSIKRNTALIKKIRSLTPDNEASLIKECEAVNQIKYVAEVAAALTEAPKKPADVTSALNLAITLHHRYPEFSSELLETLVRAFGAGAKPAPGEDERNLVRRRRAVLRLAAEAVVVGLLPAKEGAAAVAGMLQDLGSVKWDQDGEAFTRVLTLLSLFCKTPVREVLLGASFPEPTLPVDIKLLQEGSWSPPADSDETMTAAWASLTGAWQQWRQSVEEAWVLSAADRTPLCKVVERVYQTACAALKTQHSALKTLEADNARVMNSRGDLPAEATAEYEKKRQAYEGLQRALTALCEALLKPLPELAEDAFTRLDKDEGGGVKQVQPSFQDGSDGLWDDTESATFYESLPDIRSLVPAVLLGLEKPKRTEEGPAGKEVDDSTPAPAAAAPPPTAPASDTACDTAPTTGATTTPAVSAPATPSKDKAASATGGGGGGAGDGDGTAAAGGGGEEEEGGGGDGEGAGGGRSQAGEIAKRLTSCVSKDLVDEVIVAWCFHNSKSARKRLIRTLCDLPRGTGLPLVPFYARAVATLGQVFPDVPAAVIAYLEHEFNFLFNKKDYTQVSLESRLKTARYLAELCKFRLYAPGAFFVSLKTLLDDFTGLNVDSAVALVEGAGRFLLRNPDTKTRMENMLELMNRLKSVKHLDPQQVALVDGAYYTARAPRGGYNQARRKKRPPLQEYIRRLVFEELSEATLADVLKRLLRLPWAECESYVLKCMMKVVRNRATNMAKVVSLAYGLAQYYESAGIALIDGVLESIREGLEEPSRGTYQKRMAEVKLLGELYNYMLCDSAPVFEALYLLVTFGHDDPHHVAKLDPPTDYFRIRLAIALLEVCGQYFKRGRAGVKMDRFFTFFQAYVLSKVQPLPLDVDFDLQDLLHSMRPRLERFSSFQEAVAAVNHILADEAKASALGVIEEEDEEDERLAGVDDNEDEGAQSRSVRGSGRVSRSGSVRSSEDLGRSETEESDVDGDFERELAALLGPAETEEGAEEEAVGTVTFKLLMKRGGKDDRSRELQLPTTTRIATAVVARQEAEARERAQLKKLVLAANQAQEIEAGGGRHPYTQGGRGGGGGRGPGGRHADSGRGGGYSAGGGGGGGRGGGGRGRGDRGPTLGEHIFSALHK